MEDRQPQRRWRFTRSLLGLTRRRSAVATRGGREMPAWRDCEDDEACQRGLFVKRSQIFARRRGNRENTVPKTKPNTVKKLAETSQNERKSGGNRSPRTSSSSSLPL